MANHNNLEDSGLSHVHHPPVSSSPIELRARIWELTVEPRTVEVRIAHTNLFVLADVPRLISRTPVPAMLQACREARNLGLYQQAFSELSRRGGAERRYVWLNLETDMVSIGTSMFAAFKPVAPLWFYYYEVRELRDFVNVKEIHVVCAEGMRAWHGASEDHYWPCGKENVFCIDPDDDQMMRITEMDETFDQMLEEEYRKQEGEAYREPEAANRYDYPNDERLNY
ncbi:hypothetical protein C8A03DRAFT_47053 [Achaetomium macrosporum]|uniref:2EXR domain-containing protein n=1 Tax=Achaetomium macrosporum TaxID=79813 RepID=A0AAN7C3F3_9PEZI|nr:hypothetical protein C8A03DRAFT_47053 [Achaetomium macrosporum]